MINNTSLFKVLIAIIFVGCLSCKKGTDQVAENLKGTWFLLSKTVPAREYYKSKSGEWKEKYISKPKDKYVNMNDTCRFLTFENSTNYLSYSRCGDVFQDFKGKFFVLENPKRGLLTLTLVPDISVNNSDTIRTGYMNMDIRSLQNDSLILVEETTWLKDDSMPAPRFDFKYIYKKLK